MPQPGNAPFKFQLRGYNYALSDRLQLMVGERMVFIDVDQATLLLQDLLLDPPTVERLRRALAEEIPAEAVLNDHAFLERVATQLMQRTMVLWKLEPVRSERLDKLLRRFHQRIESGMQVSARDLLNPNLDTIEGHPFLKKIPPEKVLDALKELFMDMPLGDTALGRQLCDWLADTPAGRGRDLASLSPRELGDQLADQAKEWLETKLEETKQDHPVLFWSSAVAALIAAGALTYAQGTEMLEQFGIKPEYEQDLFGGKLIAKGGVSFGPQLQDPEVKLDLRTRLADGKVELGGGSTFAGEDFGHLRPTEHHFDAKLRHGASTLRGSANLAGDGDLQRYGVDGSHTFKQVGPLDRLSVMGGYERNLVTDSERITGGVKGVAKTWDFSVRGAHDLQSGGSSVIGDFGKQVGPGRLSGFVEQQFGGPSGSDTRAGILFSISF
ncbi:MAG: hypothetical protein JRI68_05550 [Deltaproteobacteria bacterium]|nr:hypothetical protein [Deltaproteobacteria bacterium]